MIQVVSINIGASQIIVQGDKKLVTGIYKSPTSSAIYLTKLQLDGDEQADLEVHGGVDKALCVYCAEHYPYWEQRLARKLEYGAFGENVTIRGLTESDVCIGDVYELGDALVQVSQPRQPCHKLAKRHDAAELSEQVQNTGFTGYYFRVMKEGLIPAKPHARLVEKHSSAVSIQFANQIKYHDKKNVQGLKRILEVDELSASWRTSLFSRLSALGE